MKQSNPISLFSFQDIVTSLTGIMIVIVLVIMLQLIDTAAVIVARSAQNPEYQILKKRQEELLAKREAAEKALSEQKKTRNDFSSISLAELKTLLKTEQQNDKQQEKQQENLTHQLAVVMDSMESRKKEIQTLKNQIQETGKDIRSLREQETELASLRKQAEDAAQKLDRKKKMLRIEFSGLREKTPILVECNSWGFRVKEYPDGPLLTFGSPGGGESQRQARRKMTEWLKQQDLYRCYPVLLFKKDAFPVYYEIVSAVMTLHPGMNIGQEPIHSEDDCFQ